MTDNSQTPVFDSSYYPVLTIAGSDCSGGAGLQADIKAISALGGYAMSAVTAVTAQNTVGVNTFAALDASLVKAQIDACVDDIAPLAVKTGMLATAAIIDVVVAEAGAGRLPNLVVDPVMVATSGDPLIDAEATAALIERLAPQTLLITPNRAEARAMTGCDNPADQIAALREIGCRNILLKGGDDNTTDYKTDLLALEGESDWLTLSAAAIDTPNTHGTGCTLSAAIATNLALGMPLVEAVSAAKSYVTMALLAGSTVRVGTGHGPMNHFHSPTPTITKPL